MIKICPNCGVEFESGIKNKIYCSGKCFKERVFIDERKLYIKWVVERKTLKQMVEIFDCSEVTIRRRMKKLGIKRSKRDPKKYENRICEHCEKLFKVSKFYVKRGQYKYCSAECGAKANSGESHVRWEPDRSKLKKKHAFYDSREWREIKKEVYKRDRGECQICKKKSKSNKTHQVHHILSYYYCPDMKLELNNLVLLCNECHNWVHSYKKNKKGLYIALPLSFKDTIKRRGKWQGFLKK